MDTDLDSPAGSAPPSVAMLLGSAFGVVAEAQRAGERTADHLTAFDARTARDTLDRAMSDAAHGETVKAEAAAAKAITIAIRALLRAQEIDVGLRRAMTTGQLYGRLSRRARTENMDKDERREVEGWIAQWLTLPPWQAPQGEVRDRLSAEAARRLDALLSGPAYVAPQVSCWLAVRRVLRLA